MKKRDENTVILLARMIVCGFVCGCLYIFIHELGHGAAALAFGARVLRFSPIRGFVATDGGQRGYFARQFFYAAGSILPTLSAAVYALFYKRGASPVYRILSALYETVCAAALFDWVLTPVLWLFGRAPRGDDCTQFLEFWTLHPLIVSAAALLAVVLLAALAARRGILSDFAETVRVHLDKDR